MRWNTPLALSLLLVGCDLDTKETDSGTLAPVDDDGDGYDVDVDCDDADPAVYPDAAEVCDGIDNDCDSLIDDDDDNVDASTGSTFYADGDSDGVGDDVLQVAACSQPSGYAAVSGDCDDGDAAVYPGAAEICDGQFNDCDAPKFDASAAPSSEVDGDKDGYVSCEYDAAVWVGDTAVLGGSDCDDTDATLNPGIVEICDNIDNDCDTLIDDTDDNLDVTTGSIFYADTDADTFGDPKNTIGACLQPKGYVTDSTDCDDGNTGVNPDAPEIPQDGTDDNCDGYDGCSDLDCDGYTDVYVAGLGSLSGEIFVGDGTSLTADTVVNGCTTYDTDLGDVNGDGYIDLVHASTSCSSGYNVFYGSSTGYSDKDALLLSDVYTYEVNVTDLDSDGYDDAVFGSISGATAYIYWGSATGLSTTAVTALPVENGWDLSIGDADGDGYEDIFFSTLGTYGYLYYGSVSGYSTTNYDTLDTSVTYGSHMEDLDNDGYADLITGAYSAYNNGTIYWGSSSGYSTTATTELPHSHSSDYNYGISTGDYNASGYQDIVFSSWSSGSSHVFYGSSSGYSSADYGTLDTSSTFRAATADLNGDGYDDVFAPSYNTGTGMVFLGSSSGLASTPDYEVTHSSAYNVSATDLDGDGYWELFMADYSGDTSLDIFWGSSSGWSDADKDTVKGTGTYSFASPLVAGPGDSTKSD